MSERDGLLSRIEELESRLASLLAKTNWRCCSYHADGPHASWCSNAESRATKHEWSCPNYVQSEHGTQVCGCRVRIGATCAECGYTFGVL